MLYQTKNVIPRDLIYVGKVIRPIMIEQKRKSLSSQALHDEQKISVLSYHYYRSIFFQLKNGIQSYDFLYHSPTYPVLPYCSPNQVLNAKILIDEIYSLSKILQNLGYPRFLSQADIKDIQGVFFRYIYEENPSSFFDFFKQIFPKLPAFDRSFFTMSKRNLSSTACKNDGIPFIKEDKNIWEPHPEEGNIRKRILF